jgi:hypothetical protein
MAMLFWYGSAQAALAFVFFGALVLVVVGVALGSAGMRHRYAAERLGRLSMVDDSPARVRVPTRSAA